MSTFNVFTNSITIINLFILVNTNFMFIITLRPILLLLHSHFDPLHLDPPGSGGFIKNTLRSIKMILRSFPASCQTCMELLMLSLSLRISWRFLVPRMFLSVVWASSLGRHTSSLMARLTSAKSTIYTRQPLRRVIVIVESPGRVVGILHIGHRHRGVGHPGEGGLASDL